MGFSTRGFSDDEDLDLHLHPHWWTFARPTALIALGLIFAGMSGRIAPTDEWYETLLVYASLALAATGALGVIGRFISWSTTHFVVTTHRVIYQKGFLGRQRLEIPLQRVNNVMYEQSFFERLVNSGDVIVESGGDDREVRFDNTRDPEQVQARIQRAVRALDRRQ
ncbi:MAG: PH domain-containing protein [Actinomycetota bacterium]